MTQARLALLGLLLVGSAWGQTVPRLALVIGNVDYGGNLVNLVTPINDARLMADVLTDAGFKVTKLENARSTDMQRGIATLAQQLKKSQGVGVFYFAGQAVGVQGEHYLLPVDTALDSFAGIVKAGITLRSVNTQLQQAKNKLTILVVDANADDSYNMLTSASQQANLLIPAPPNTVIAIAAKPPSYAYHNNKIGLYTKNLAQALNSPGSDLSEVFARTERAVREQSAEKQLPWSSINVAAGSTGTGFYFKPKVAPLADDPKVFGRSARGG